ncbi:metal ABC transporter ATP-binding protein [Aeromicrobium sp. CTD01-1L150]|uniref:metal ABC transporter ATP-binding protein n=1 Tax=Aeromicrobium sp. CTD01-1L150 TaxID=3341830 RepID=UPI0035BF86A3
MTTALSITQLDVELGGRPVLRDVCLDVARGEFVALLGANGSGKSTLVRSAVGLVPFTGSIKLFDTPLQHFRDRSRLGYVPQRAATVTGVPATVTEVVASGRLSRRRLAGLPRAADRAAVAEAIDVVGLGPKAKAPLIELSGGQQQRVHIARALAGAPELMIMDEPTAGVDRENTEVLAGLLSDLAGAGTAVLLVAHELGPMRPLLDRAVVMTDGSITHDGDPAAVGEGDHEHTHLHSGEPDRLEPLPGEGVWP